MLRKITRILLKSIGILVLLLFLSGLILFFAIQSYTFQTWLGKKAGNYLSHELHTTVSINKINLDFFSRAELEGVFIKDLHGDTLLHGNIIARLNNLNFRKNKLIFEKITLKNFDAKLITYKNDSVFNYQFLYDYFNGSDSSSTGPDWELNFGDIFLDNVNFTYRDDNQDTRLSENINFNNLSLKGATGKVSGLKIQGDTVLMAIYGLNIREQSGFKITHLTTQARISSKELYCGRLYLRTTNSLVKGNLQFKYSDWSDYSEFFQKVAIKIDLANNSYLHFADLARFAPELNGLEETVHLSGKIKGNNGDLNFSNFKLAYGKYTFFSGNLAASGLPDFKNIFLHLDVKQITSNYADLVKIPSYPFTSGKKMEIPKQLLPLGTISFKGKFDGFLNDFTTYGDFKTALGRINTNISVQLKDVFEEMAYQGRIKTEDFNIGALAGVSALKNLTFNADVKGKGLSLKTLNTNIEGTVHNITYNNYEYKNVLLDGKFREKIFNGLLKSRDPNADLDFDGKINFNNRIPEMDFMATVNNLDLKKLHISKNEFRISTQLLIVLKGDDINNLTGDINFDNTVYTNAEKSFRFSNFDLLLDQAQAEKRIDITTSFINLGVSGRFNLTNLPLAFNHFLSSYYPAFFTKTKSKTTPTDAFQFNLKIKKFDVIRDLFVKNLMVSPNTIIGGDFDVAENLFNLTLKADSIKYGNVKFHNGVIESYSQHNKINLVFKSNRIQLTDSIKLENYFMYLVSKDKDTKYNLEWDNKKLPNVAGKIAGHIHFNNTTAALDFDNFFITTKDSAWHLVDANPTIIDTGGKVTVNPLLFASFNQKIGIAGVISNSSADSLVLHTENVVLEQFNPLLQTAKIKLEGVLNGKLATFHSNGYAFNSDLRFTGMKINNNSLGLLVLKSHYNASEKHIFLEGYSSLGLPGIYGGEPAKNISFKGFYHLDRKEESINVDFTAAPADLKLLNPFVEGILTINNAFANGQAKLHGSLDNVKIDGKFKLYNADIKVDYTNVTYLMSGQVEMMTDQIRFSDITMKEKGTKGAPTGTINGNIFHNNFNSIQLDYDVTYRNMLVLNTSEKENKTFYGKLYGTGNIGIWGFLNSLHMSITDTTTKNSKFFLPLDGPAEVEESDFIHFVKKDTVKVKKDDRLTGFDLEMNVNVTPDLQSQIILDKKTGDILNVQGSGDLKLKINTLGKFEMLGDYFITNGDYRFTLENVINKKFDIEAGSSIAWSGDPMKADVNIVTSYKQRASVAPLLNDTTDEYKNRVAVDCKLIITDKLFSPDIKFGIEFPTINATARARIDNLLSDEAELNRQVFSFLLFRSFVTPLIYNPNGGGVTAGSAAASTGSEMLSNQVSSFLNSYVGSLTGLKDLNLGLNYRPGSQSNSDAVDIALSKQLFNNKVSVGGNFGVNNNQTNRNSSGIIDVNIEYKLTPDGRYRLKGFNRSNDVNQITTTGGPYTQGVGVFYREEFETFNQLFQRYLKRIKKKKEETSSEK